MSDLPSGVPINLNPKRYQIIKLEVYLGNHLSESGIESGRQASVS